MLWKTFAIIWTNFCIFFVILHLEMIDPETIQRIKDAVRIEEVVGEFVSLKKRGSNYIACCPFHNEKTPSFVVTPAKNIYKCFGCGKAGDGVRFLMEHEHYSYQEALRYLAKKYNIDIVEGEQTPEQRQKQNERDVLYHVSEFAQKYFADLLYNDEMGRAVGLNYFHGRGMTDEIIKRFGLGYCLDEWRGFTDYARKNGYSDEVLKTSGLTVFTDEGKVYDRFRGRVTFPIFSTSGRVMGFSCRILTKDKDKAKYVNSPDSPIYDKSNTLYGLYQARQAIAKADKCYLVEGNVDVVSMHQSGVENTVASCGTSLTVGQIRLIRRYTKNVTVVYDGDKAGVKATIRATDLLFEEGMHVRMVMFPDDDDPDSYAQKHGSTMLQEYLRDHEENIVLYQLRVMQDDVKNDPIRKAEMLKDIVKTIALVPDLLERSEYVKICASRFGMSEQTLQRELANALYLKAQKEFKASQDKNGQPAVAETPLSQEDAAAPASAVSAPEQVAVPTVSPQTAALYNMFPDELQENKIIRLLINNGNQVIKQTVKVEGGKTEEHAEYVAAVIVGDIYNDGLTFDNPIYQTIFNAYAQKLQQGTLLDSQFFVDNPDEQIRSTALEMMVEPYTVSDQWEKLHHVSVQHPENHVAEDVENALNIFKLRKIDHKMNDLAQQFKAAGQDEKVLEALLQEKMALLAAKKELCAQIHCVYN